MSGWLHRRFWLAVLIVVAITGTLEVTSALGETQSYDEGIHLSTGYVDLTRGQTLMYDHPPLARMLCALPLVPLRPDVPTKNLESQQPNLVLFGIDFLYGNRVKPDTMLMAGRSVTILFSLLFLISVAAWTRRRFGPAAGLVAVILCGLDPNLIAHGRYITTDFPLTAVFVIACLLWADYVESGRVAILWLAAAAFGLAQVVKFNAVLLAPIFLAIYGANWLLRPREFPLRRFAAACGALFIATVAVVAITYAPDTVRMLSGRLQGRSTPAPEGMISTVLFHLARWTHTSGHGYVIGLSNTFRHNAGGHESYLLGMHSLTGWWYYFPVVFAVKSTLSALIATVVLAAAVIVGASHAASKGVAFVRAVPPVWIGLIVPPVLYFGISMAAGINIGVRHILCVYPFLYIGAAALLVRLPARRFAQYGLVALAGLQAVEAAVISPHYLAYFNPLAGGPRKGPEYVVDSNIDWGQDVKKLHKWLQARGTNRAWMAYFGNALPGYYGIERVAMPPGRDRAAWDRIDGYAVASVTYLKGVYMPLEELAPLRAREPVARVGWSLYVYEMRGTRPHSAREGKLVRRPGAGLEDGKVYWVHEGVKHWVTDSNWIVRHGYRWPDDVIVIPPVELDEIPLGDPISSDVP